MVPREATRGGSFKSAGLYYLHDKNHADTAERVAFTHTENVPTRDPQKALNWMAFTAMHADELKHEAGVAATGRKCEKPVFTFSLAWHPEQKPEQWEMIAAGRQALSTLGLEDHQAVMAAHSDREHPHLHVIVNIIHPETGKAQNVYKSQIKLSEWAEEYERENGKIYCEERVENNKKRRKEPEPEPDFKTRITQLYHSADSAKAFQAALTEHGYKLQQGKRIIIIDREGKEYSLYRQIEGVKSKDIKARLAGLELPEAEETRGGGDDRKKRAGEQQQDKEEKQDAAPLPPKEKEPVYFDRDRQEREQDERIIDAAIKAEQEKGTAEGIAASRSARAAQRRSRPDDESEEENRLRNTNRLFKIQNANTRAVIRLREKLAAVDAKLEAAYGEDERALRGGLQKLEARQQKAGFWSKITGAYGRRQKEIENERASLQNIEMRKEEQRGAHAAILEQRKQRAAMLNERLKELTAPPRPAKEPAPAREVQQAVKEPAPPAPQPAARAPSPANDFDEAARKYGTTPEYERQREAMNRQQEQQREQSRDPGPDRER